MSEILFFTDIHIHQHKKSSDRLDDCLNVLRWVFDTAIERKIENVIFLGDLFQDRQKIETITYLKTYHIFEEYLLNNPKFNLYLLLGNHDLWYDQKCDISSVIPLRSLEGVTVIDKPCTLKIADQDISFIPFTKDPIEEIKNIKNKSNYKILCSHVAIDGAMYNIKAGTTSDISIEHDGEMTKVDVSLFKKWDNVFLGHYHAYQLMENNVEYIGSPLQLNFGEAFQKKYIVVLNLETKEKEYIENNFSPTHLIIKEQEIDNYDLENNFIKLEVDDISDNANTIDLRNKILEKNKVGSFEIKQSTIKKDDQEDEKLIEEAKSILFKQGEMINKYVEQQQKLDVLGDLDEEKLLEIGQSIIYEIQN